MNGLAARTLSLLADVLLAAHAIATAYANAFAAAQHATDSIKDGR